MLVPLKHKIQLSQLEDPPWLHEEIHGHVLPASRVPALSRDMSFTFHNSPLKYCCSRLSDEENWASECVVFSGETGRA